MVTVAKLLLSGNTPRYDQRFSGDAHGLQIAIGGVLSQTADAVGNGLVPVIDPILLDRNTIQLSIGDGRGECILAHAQIKAEAEDVNHM